MRNIRHRLEGDATLLAEIPAVSRPQMSGLTTSTGSSKLAFALIVWFIDCFASTGERRAFAKSFACAGRNTVGAVVCPSPLPVGED